MSMAYYSVLSIKSDPKVSRLGTKSHFFSGSAFQVRVIQSSFFFSIHAFLCSLIPRPSAGVSCVENTANQALWDRFATQLPRELGKETGFA